MLTSALNAPKKAADRLARPDIFFYAMPFLMIALIAGTVSQKDLGLYLAYKTYMEAPFYWLGFLPLPGANLVLAVITLSLLCKFLFKSEWSWKKSGIILSHFGALFLLIGGLLIALSAHERYMIIAEGEQTPYAYDYIKRELAIFKNGTEPVARVDFDRLIQADSADMFKDLPFSIDVLSSCRNCNIIRRENAETSYNPDDLRGMARFMALTSKPEEKDPEINFPGVTLQISGLQDEANGLYLAFEHMPQPVRIPHDGQEYTLILGKAQTKLPFSLFLDDFIMDTYPGTRKARGYSSDIVVHDNGTSWPVRIEMNKPLRYKGYTFYQSSFDERPDNTDVTILSVVENQGRLFPYIATALIAAGLLLHVLIVFTRRSRKTVQI